MEACLNQPIRTKAARTHRGDRDPRFEQVCVRYAKLVDAALRSQRVPSVSVPDAAQDVLLILHRRFGVFEASKDPGAWLRSTACYVARNYLRAARRAAFRGSGSSMFDPDELAAPHALPEELLSSCEQRALFSRALASVHPKRREVFRLAELDGLTARQIGARIGISPGTVASRLRRARAEFVAAARCEHNRRPSRSSLRAAPG